MYLWMPVPGGDDRAFSERLLLEADVMVSPGSAYGAAGAGYVRLALTVPDARLAEAMERLVRAL
jgi:LL-diaminopimelate aminotransferase